MLALKVEKRLAEKARRALLELNAFGYDSRPSRDKEFVYFPLSKRVSLKIGQVVQKNLEEKEKHYGKLKDVLAGKLTEKEKKHFVSSFDVVGDIAVLEVRQELWAKRRMIAKAVLETHKNVKVVLAKKTAMRGVFRVRRFHRLAGAKRFTTLYRESGCVMKVNLAKVYFSVRLATERQRIASLAKKKERVLIPFAGVGPFALVIARKQPTAEIVAVELNPFAFRLMKENVLLNKVKNVTPVQGDALRVLKKYVNWADRVVMPLPHTGEDFLDCMLPCVKRGGVVHFYGFGPIENPFEEIIERIMEKCRARNRACRLVFKRVVRPYSPFLVQVVVDFAC